MIVHEYMCLFIDEDEGCIEMHLEYEFEFIMWYFGLLDDIVDLFKDTERLLETKWTSSNISQSAKQQTLYNSNQALIFKAIRLLCN